MGSGPFGVSSRQILGYIPGKPSLVLTIAVIRPLVCDQRRPRRTTRADRDLVPRPSLAGLSSPVIHSPTLGPIHRPGDNQPVPGRGPFPPRLLPPSIPLRAMIRAV